MTIDELQSLYAHIFTLKRLKRAGWIRNNIAEPESVADHSFGLALISIIFAKHMNLDIGKAGIMATLHDIGESIVGDITPHDKVAQNKKFELESQAVKDILRDEGLYNLWLDFELGRTPEGRLVKQLDKLEAYLQGRAYNISGLVREEFFQSTQAALVDKEIADILNLLEKTDKDQA